MYTPQPIFDLWKSLLLERATGDLNAPDSYKKRFLWTFPIAQFTHDAFDRLASDRSHGGCLLLVGLLADK